MSELFNITIEDDDGSPILPRDSRTHGNAFAVHILPQRGDEVQVNDTRYTVIDIIHRLYPDSPNQIAIRLKLMSVDLGDYQA